MKKRKNSWNLIEHLAEIVKQPETDIELSK